MKLLVPVVTGFVAIAAIIGIGVGLQQRTSAVDLPYNCSVSGTFTAPTTGPAALTGDDQASIVMAKSWIEAMTKTRTATVTNSTITPASDYATSYQGAVSGTFTLQDRTFPTNASISVTSPSTMSDNYRGVVSGQVLETPSAFRWIIQAYKRNNGVITQVPLQTLADGVTGNFSIDLSGVDPSLTGEWMFGLLDANASYAPYGTQWPDANYVGLEVQQYVVTDSTYYWSTTAAKTNGTFAFPNSNTGSKLFRLVDTTTNPDEILAEYVKPTGLLRSYEYQVGETGYGTALENRSFVYDQAVALFAAISVEDDELAKLLVDGLLELQTTSGEHAGGFVFAAPQLSPTYTDMLYRTGAHAIATDALLAYIEKYPNDAQVAAYTDAAVAALEFLQGTQSTVGLTDGLYTGGYGLYSGNPQTFDPTYGIEWASTEHNIDAWHTLMRASNVLGDTAVDYAARAAALDTAITNHLYNEDEQRFNQGINEGGKDLSDPLDTNSWGAIQLYASGKPGPAHASLGRLPLFAHSIDGVEGYGPFYEDGGYPGATPTVWFEGSFGVALAYYKAGDYDAYRELLDSLIIAQQNDGSFRYATDVDAQYDIGISKSVASTAWYILATAGRDVIWNTCLYSPPIEDEDDENENGQPPVSSGKPAGQNSSIGRDQLSHNYTPEDLESQPADDTTTPDGSTETPGSEYEESSDDSMNQFTSQSLPWILAGGALVVIAGTITWLVRRRA